MADETKNETEELAETKTTPKTDAKLMTTRLGIEEWEMVKELKGRPHYVNIAQYIRDSIRHLYQTRTNKAGRVK